jgi:hypothetical protein
MGNTPKRKISEIITLYTLHPELKDIYVEGVTDNIIVESFLKTKGITNVKIYNIDDFDFSELYQQNQKLKDNCKLKLIALSEQINSVHNNSIKFVCCIADRDFDDLSGVTYNSYVILTDFTDMEMYLFNEECINLFYKNILHTFPFDAKTTIRESSGPLSELFLIRYAIKLLCDKPCEFIDIKNTCEIERKTGKINFNHVEYLNRMLGKLSQFQHREKYLDHIGATKSKLPKEIRLRIRGHDFTHLFFLYVHKIKNDIRINEETLERAFFMCLDRNTLSKYRLFDLLLSKYTKA